MGGNIMMILVSKEEAKRMIDESPSEMIVISTINPVTLIHGTSKKVKKKKGKSLVDKATEIKYQNNDFFGMLSLYGVLEKNMDTNVIHNISFPQME